MRSLPLITALFLAGTLICTPKAAHSQSQDAPFSTARIGMHLTTQFSQNTFKEYWDSPIAVETFIAFPFYWGEIEAHAGFYPYQAIRDDTMDFVSVLTWLGWGKSLQITDRLNIFGGFLVGNNYMSFEENSLFKGESELIAGYYSRLSYTINDQWLVHLSANRTRTFTFRRIDMTHISFGLSRKFNTPGWLQTFLQ